MAENCIALEVVAYASEAWRARASVRLADVARVTDVLTVRPHGRLADSALATDTIKTHTFSRIEDVAAVGEAWRSVVDGSVRIEEVARARDGLRAAIHSRWSDGAEAGDAVVARRHMRLSDAGEFTEQWAATGSPHGRVADVARVRDAIRLKRAARLADGFVASESLAARPRTRLADAGRFAEALRPIRQLRIRLHDAVEVSDAVVARGAPRTRLADEVFISDRWRLPRAPVALDGHIAHRVGAATAWTTNTDTWGASRYTDFEFNSVAVVDGVLMGANDAGLWRLDAADDDGQPILAHVQTDMQDYASEHVKSAPLVYAGMDTDGAMQLTVDAVIKGTPAHYTYTFEARQAGDFAPGRCKIGRGVRSRYLQFTVGNHSGDGTIAAGADFTIDQLSVLAEAGSRRI